jgi:hypothetical protein
VIVSPSPPGKVRSQATRRSASAATKRGLRGSVGAAISAN